MLKPSTLGEGFNPTMTGTIKFTIKLFGVRKCPLGSGHYAEKELTISLKLIHDMFACTCMRIACVTPKNAERVPSIPDMTSGNKSFRITIVRPKPRALKIPIRVCVTERMLCSTQSVDHLIGPVPSPNKKENVFAQYANTVPYTRGS